MDVLADLLARGRARGSVFAQTPICRGCGVEFGGKRLLAVHTIVEGTAWFERDDFEPVELHAGDLILVPTGTPYRVVGQPGERTRAHGAEDGTEAPDDAIVARLMCGAYTMDAVLSDLLLDALPLLVPISGEVGDRRLRMVVALLDEELAAPQPGSQTVLDRSLDLLLALGLRAWFAHPGADVPGWYAALNDPVAGPAVSAIHTDPAGGWTVARLAQLAGVSRAAFASRFSAVVGQSPISYLTNWRMSIAAQAFTDEPAATIAAIAQRVGYANEYAFATAFRRHFGQPPGRWRRRDR